MGFFTKTREKGLKSVTKEKLKKSTTKTTTATTVVEKKAIVAEVKNSSNEEQDKKRIKSTETPKNLSNISNNAISSIPWWVSDASFMVEGKKISAHKVVISSKSKILTSLIESSPNGVVEIVNYSHNIFSQLIKWVYGSRFEISSEDSTILKNCAIEFEIQDLVDACLLVEEANQIKPVIVAYNLQDSLRSSEDQLEPISQENPTYEDILYEVSDYQNPVDSILPSQLVPDYGMSLYSEDPILFNPDPNEVDEFRLMEIF